MAKNGEIKETFLNVKEMKFVFNQNILEIFVDGKAYKYEANFVNLSNFVFFRNEEGMVNSLANFQTIYGNCYQRYIDDFPISVLKIIRYEETNSITISMDTDFIQKQIINTK